MPGIQTTIATFGGSDPVDSNGNVYRDLTFALAYTAAAAWAPMDGVTSSSGGVAVWIEESSRTGAGCRVMASDQFTGTVPVISIPIP